MGLMDDVRYAVRALRRRPGVTLFAALTVAAGIGASSTVFSAFETVLLRPLPFEGGERMVALWRTIGNSGSYTTPAPDQVEAWSAEDELFEGVEVLESSRAVLTGHGPARALESGLVRATFFDFTHQTPRLGRAFTDEEMVGGGARVVLLGHDLWVSAFGRDEGVLGTAITLDGEPWTVIGVMPKGAVHPVFRALPVDVWQPLSDARAARGASVLGLLREGVTLEAVNRRLEEIQARAVAAGEEASQWGGRALLQSEMIGSMFREALRVLAVAVVLLLAITCVNVSNLLLGQSMARREETAVRSALGCGPRRLLRQSLIESLVLAGLGGLLGVLLAYAAVNVIPRLRPDRLAALDSIQVDVTVLAFAIGAALLTGLTFGTVPAWLRSRAASSPDLRAGSDGAGRGRSVLSWGLIGVEVALSFALVVGSTLLFRSLASLQDADPGFRSEEIAVFTVGLPGWKYPDEAERARVYEAMMDRLSGLGGIEAAVASSGLPPQTGVRFGVVEVEGQEPDSDTSVLFGPDVASDYFATVGQRLVAGRGFSEAEVADGTPVAVLGESTAKRFFPGGDAVGRRMRVGGDEWITVVGVAADVAMSGLSTTAVQQLQMYEPLSRVDRTRTFVLRVARDRDIHSVVSEGAHILRSVEPDILLSRSTTAADMFARTLALERFTTVLLASFTGVALLLSVAGLYGVVAQVVSQRTREIGIRMTLGARPANVQRLVVARGSAATLAGIVAGTGLALLGLRALSSRMFGLDAATPSAFLVGALALTVSAVLACWAPARRATRIDPMEALREG